MKTDCEYEVAPFVTDINANCESTSNALGYSLLDKFQNKSTHSVESYLKPITEPISAHKFYRPVGRDEGNKLLQNALVGTYLIRPSSRSNYVAVLMVRSLRSVIHVPIMCRTNSGKLYLKTVKPSGESAHADCFDSLSELLEHFTKKEVIDCVLLPNGANIVPD